MDELRAAASKKDNDRMAHEMGKKLLRGPWDCLPCGSQTWSSSSDRSVTAPDMIDYYLDLSTPKQIYGQTTSSPDRIEGSLLDEEDPDSARLRARSRDAEYGYDHMDNYNDMDMQMDAYGDTRYEDVSRNQPKRNLMEEL